MDLGWIETLMIAGLIVGLIVIFLLGRALTAGPRRRKRLLDSLSRDPREAEALDRIMRRHLEQARQFGIESGMSAEESSRRHAEIVELYESGEWKKTRKGR